MQAFNIIWMDKSCLLNISLVVNFSWEIESMGDIYVCDIPMCENLFDVFLLEPLFRCLLSVLWGFHLSGFRCYRKLLEKFCVCRGVIYTKFTQFLFSSHHWYHQLQNKYFLFLPKIYFYYRDRMVIKTFLSEA